VTDHRPWRDLSLEQRYALLHGPRPEPAMAVSGLASVLRGVAITEEERERQSRDVRRARALIAIENAEREQAEEAERERQEFRHHVVRETAIGRLLGGANGGR
jgi:hypothetical protein